MDEEKVLQLERTWGVAPVEGDLDTVGRVVADDWVGVAPTGETMSKADLLEMLAANPGVFDTVAYDDVSVRVYGAAAVVMSAFRGTGKEMTLSQRYLRVYAKRNGEWQCVATQIVPTA